MSNCTRIKPKPYKICTGDLRYPIVIQQRTKISNNINQAEPNIIITVIKTLFALQQSVNGEEIFNDSNMLTGKVTDVFYVRYGDSIGINKTHIISFNGNHYTIESILPDIQGRREFAQFRCCMRGLDTLQVNELDS